MTDEALLSSPQYKNLCELVSLFAKAKGLDDKSKDDLATLVSLAIRTGANLASVDTISSIISK